MTFCTLETKPLIQKFEKTINSNLQIATKEIWYVSSTHPIHPENNYCIVRHIWTHDEHIDSLDSKEKAKWLLALAKRDFRNIVLASTVESTLWMMRQFLKALMKVFLR